MLLRTVWKQLESLGFEPLPVRGFSRRAKNILSVLPSRSR